MHDRRARDARSRRIAAELRESGTLVADCVVDTQAEPALRAPRRGRAARRGGGGRVRRTSSRASGRASSFTTASPAWSRTEDRDLALLAGDYLYALGLALLAELGDLEAVRVLAELIALCAHAPAGAEADVGALWLAGTIAVAAGEEPRHAAAKEALRAGEPAADLLWAWAAGVAAREGLEEQLGAAAETVGFRATERG